MNNLIKMLNYPTEIELPKQKKEDAILQMFGYKKKELSQRQLDMINYHTSIETPSFLQQFANIK